MLNLQASAVAGLAPEGHISRDSDWRRHEANELPPAGDVPDFAVWRCRATAQIL